MATAEVTFVDKIHVAGRVKDGEFDHTKSGYEQLKSYLNSFDNQADNRKFHQPSLWPGAWNRLIIHTDTPFPNEVYHRQEMGQVQKESLFSSIHC